MDALLKIDPMEIGLRFVGGAAVGMFMPGAALTALFAQQAGGEIAANLGNVAFTDPQYYVQLAVRTGVALGATMVVGQPLSQAIGLPATAGVMAVVAGRVGEMIGF